MGGMSKLSDIKAFAFDIDGVFTDGGLLCYEEGRLIRRFDAKDGFAVRLATLMGYPIAIITGASSEIIPRRFRDLGVPECDVFLHARKKSVPFLEFCNRHSLEPSKVLFMGDDIPDLDAIAVAGYSIAPADAAAEVIAASDEVSSRPGGHGCVREAIEKVLKEAGKWTFSPDEYARVY